LLDKKYQIEDEYKFLTEICGFDGELAILVINSLKENRFSKNFLQRAPLTIRANNLECGRDILFQALIKNFSIEKTNISPFGITFKDNINVRNLIEFKKGMFEIQDEASQLVSLISPIVPSNKILDYCAGSGGKSLAIYSRFYGSIYIDVNDISQKRLSKLFQRAKRLGYYLEKIKSKKKYYDFVLVDVPCSGLGSIRRDVDLHIRTSKKSIEEKIEIQKNIFDESLQFVKNKGFILYVTCSFLEEENERQVEFFLDKYSNLELIDLKEKVDKAYLKVINTKGFFKTGPWINNMDSFFGALFRVN
jgi:16S rRNA (cytosine967-C5)-methyltransferase